MANIKKAVGNLCTNMKRIWSSKRKILCFLQNKSIRRRLGIMMGCCITVGGLTVAGMNIWVKHSVEACILAPEQAIAESNGKYDCIIVLGCLVKADGTPSDMLRDRLDRGIALYQQNVAPKILMSGDHGQSEYDEVNAMKQYAIDAGVPSADIFMDHAGFSTYETMYRAKEIFGAERVLVVTQEYHLYRAVYIARQLGMQADGVNADYHRYMGQGMRDFREALARCKDFIMCIVQPEPTYLGETVSLAGSGDITNDKIASAAQICSENSDPPFVQLVTKGGSFHCFTERLQQSSHSRMGIKPMQ